jgi:hypothetical protein
MKKIFTAALALAFASSTAFAAYQSIESFSTMTTVTNGNQTPTPTLLPGNPDLGTGFVYDNSYEYLPMVLVNNAADVFPSPTIVGDTKALRVANNTDQFLRVYNNTNPIPNTTTKIQFAIAIKVNGVSSTPDNNTVDVIRVMDQAGTGSAANVFAIVFDSGALRFATNGLSGIVIDPAGATNLNDGAWRVIAAEINRDSANGSLTAQMYNHTTGNGITPIVQSGLTNTNLNPIHTLAFGATFDEPAPGSTADFNITIDEIKFYNEATTEDFLAAVRSEYNIPASNVEDWMAF